MIYNFDNQLFVLQTTNTTYAFRVMECGYLEHLYYGKKIKLTPAYASALFEKKEFAIGNAVSLDQDHLEICLEDLRLEWSGYGKGDIREPMIEVTDHLGFSTSDFRFEKAEIRQGKTKPASLPASYDETGSCQELVVTLYDQQMNLHLELVYAVFEDCNVITRRARLVNHAKTPVVIHRLMSSQLDLEGNDWVFTTFTGAWAREMQKTNTTVRAGKLVNSSYTGTSSNRSNPFVILQKEKTTEDAGPCYGMNLVWSGNHYEALEVSTYQKTRFVCGINPQNFAWTLDCEETFETPEAIMTYSQDGLNAMSQNLHAFVNNHIVRGKWKGKPRPVLLNSWEASYFDISEGKLLKLAKAAKEVGIELFVMDDGWFGNRNDDTTSLGDWTPNLKKLPGGVKRLADKVNALGLEFGIWVEPEMINVQSELYKAHPEWVIENPVHHHSEGRNQRILDLSQKAVQDYLIETMSALFESANIAYVKWDMNRVFSDVYSQALQADRQQELFTRYVLGLYRVMEELTSRFDEILFEGCAAGGNRFDLGILCYFPQIWASDDTDALVRAQMQTNYSYGYPMSVISAHVSASPNHQTLRQTALDTRFHVACFGVLGYELNLCELSKKEREKIKDQIAWYKTWRQTLQYGNFYRVSSFEDQPESGILSAGSLMEWCTSAKDQKKAIGFMMNALSTPNMSTAVYKAKGLDPEMLYRFQNVPVSHELKEFGSLVNHVSPIHVKQNSLLHSLMNQFVKIDGEKEEYVVPGDLLMEAGVHLKQGFGGTGYNSNVRFLVDFTSRLYTMEEAAEMNPQTQESEPAASNTSVEEVIVEIEESTAV